MEIGSSYNSNMAFFASKIESLVPCGCLKVYVTMIAAFQ